MPVCLHRLETKASATPGCPSACSLGGLGMGPGPGAGAGETTAREAEPGGNGKGREVSLGGKVSTTCTQENSKCS